MNASSFGTV